MNMHVAMVTPFIATPNRICGGVAGVAKYLGDELAALPEIRLSIVEPKSGLGTIVRQQWQHYDVYRVGKCGPFRKLSGTLYDMLFGRRQINALLEELQPDLVHFQSEALLAVGCRLPHLLTIHGIAERDAIWSGSFHLSSLRWLRRTLLRMNENRGRRSVPYLIMISEYIKEFLPRNNHLRRTWLIENPIADSYFDVVWRPEPGRVLACSRVLPRKNTAGMIRAFAEVVRRVDGAQLRLAGSAQPRYLEECRQLIAELELADRVLFLGNLSVAEVQQELSRASCLLIPSFQETAPLAIEEAMAVGVPVVGSDLCGIPFMVEEGGTGFLVDPEETGKIAERVCRLLTEGELAAEMSRRARQVARSRFRAPAIAQQTAAVYQKILGAS